MEELPARGRASDAARWLFLGTVWSLLAASCDGEALTTRSRVTQKRFIGFSGSEMVRPASVKIARAEAQGLPLDGLVIDMGFSHAVWKQDPGSFADALALAESLGRATAPVLRESFQQVQLSGDPLWMNAELGPSFAANWRSIGRAVQSAGLRGVFIDPLPYGSDAWTPPAGSSFEQARGAARARGLAVGRELFAAAPGITVLLALGYSEVLRGACLEVPRVPLAESPYALYPAFLDGLSAARDEAANGVTIVDAFLPSYPTKSRSSFALFRSLVHFRWDHAVAAWRPGVVSLFNPSDEVARLVTWPDGPALGCPQDELLQLARDLPVGFSLWVDARFPVGQPFATDPAGFSSNHFLPDELAEAVKAARDASDRYVVFWTGSVDWWNDGQSANRMPMPKAYRDAVAAGHP